MRQTNRKPKSLEMLLQEKADAEAIPVDVEEALLQTLKQFTVSGEGGNDHSQHFPSIMSH